MVKEYIKKYKSFMWFGALAILNLLDCWTTVIGMHNGFKEINFLMAWIIKQGIGYFILFKIAITPLFLSPAIKAHKGDPKRHKGLKIITFVFLAVVLNNAINLLVRFFL